MHVPLVDLKAQYPSIKDEVDAAVARVLESGKYVMGREVEAFEAEWAAFCRARYCVGVSSATDGLVLALLAATDLFIRGVGRSRIERVLTTPLTFWATTHSIMHAGLTPVFCDVNDDGVIDITRDELPPHDGMAVPVHLYGRAAPISERYPGRVIEDAAQSHGQPLRGHAAVFSFYPTKNLGAMGQAGAIVTNDSSLAQRLRSLRVYGEEERFVTREENAGNHRMDELQAAILRAKLPHLRLWNIRRRDIAEMYTRGLAAAPGVIPPRDSPEHVYHAYVVRTPRRDSLAKHLAAAGIETSVRYPVPMHQMPIWRRESLHWQDLSFPNAERWCRENLNLPIYPEMTDEQVEYVIAQVCEWAQSPKVEA